MIAAVRHRTPVDMRVTNANAHLLNGMASITNLFTSRTTPGHSYCGSGAAQHPIEHAQAHRP